MSSFSKVPKQFYPLCIHKAILVPESLSANLLVFSQKHEGIFVTGKDNAYKTFSSSPLIIYELLQERDPLDAGSWEKPPPSSIYNK